MHSNTAAVTLYQDIQNDWKNLKSKNMQPFIISGGINITYNC